MVCAPVVEAQTLTIVHVRLIDVVSGQVQPDSTVVVTGNRITSVEPTTGALPKVGRVVDAKGEYLIPGLWDMHTHVYDMTAVEKSELTLPLFIANGITGCLTIIFVPIAAFACLTHILLGSFMISHVF